MEASPFPSVARQIHLDFHTSPLIEEVGSLFDPETFAETMEKARVNSVTVFAKCHHGHLYFETAHEARHPGMKEGLLERQIAALRRRGIRCPIYISVQCDEFAANSHPDWRAIAPDGTNVGRRPLTHDFFSWQILDMASPYLAYLEAQTEEVLRKFTPLDGLFFDMCWDQPSVSKWAVEGMKTLGLDPECEKAREEHAGRVTQEYMTRLTELVERFQKDVPIWFNSRPIADAFREKKLLRHLEIEALPTGQWGYGYFPVWARYGKTLGLPMIGMTGRFHKSWADFGGIRTSASLRYDCALALAHGAGCSIGDQLHPSGQTDKGVYEVIGDAFRHVEKCEPWCAGVASAAEIGVLFCRPAAENQAERCFDGAAKALGQLRYQFVFVEPEDSWESLPLIIVPEPLALSDELRKRLAAYRDRGGRVLWESSGDTLSPFSMVYLRFPESTRGALADTDHVFYERGYQLEAKPGDEILARVVEPYFERQWDQFCSHAQTPANLEPSRFVAGFIRGGEGFLAMPVFRAYSEHGNLCCRQLVAAALKRLLPDPVVRINGPSYVEVLAGRRAGEVILHFLSYIPQKRAAKMEMVEEAVAARNIEVDVRVDGEVSSVKRIVDARKIPFTQEGDRVRFSLDWLEGHEVVVIASDRL